MKFSYHWLQELSQTKKSPAELAEFLTLRAFEVESVDPIGFRNDRVVIGDVIELAPHPNADRLRVATVCIGIETLSIVCGAHNIAQGQKVAVALEGAVLPGNFIIEKTKIRNVESCGMICSQRELDTGTDHEGIWVLPTNAEVGLLLENFLNTADVLLDIKVLPDRAHDCLSHVGMAREIVALEGRTFDYDYDGLLLPDIRKNPSSIRVALDAEQRSMRYVVALVRDCLLYTSPSPRDATLSRMPSSA